MIHLLITGHWPKWGPWIPVFGNYTIDRKLMDRRICRVCNGEKIRYY